MILNRIREIVYGSTIIVTFTDLWYYNSSTPCNSDPLKPTRRSIADKINYQIDLPPSLQVPSVMM